MLRSRTSVWAATIGRSATRIGHPRNFAAPNQGTAVSSGNDRRLERDFAAPNQGPRVDRRPRVDNPGAQQRSFAAPNRAPRVESRAPRLRTATSAVAIAAPSRRRNSAPRVAPPSGGQRFEARGGGGNGGARFSGGGGGHRAPSRRGGPAPSRAVAEAAAIAASATATVAAVVRAVRVAVVASAATAAGTVRSGQELRRSSNQTATAQPLRRFLLVIGRVCDAAERVKPGGAGRGECHETVRKSWIGCAGVGRAGGRECDTGKRPVLRVLVRDRALWRLLRRILRGLLRQSVLGAPILPALLVPASLRLSAIIAGRITGAPILRAASLPALLRRHTEAIAVPITIRASARRLNLRP